MKRVRYENMNKMAIGSIIFAVVVTGGVLLMLLRTLPMRNEYIDNSVTVHFALGNTMTIDMADAELKSVPKEATEHLIRTNGTSLGKKQSGHFKNIKTGDKFLFYITGKGKKVYFEKDDNKYVIDLPEEDINTISKKYGTMKETDLSVLGAENQFDLIGKQWMLITAGTKESFNTMTASWGGLGWLWNRPVAFIFVRPERYTHDFIEESDRLTLSFYPESCRKALQICGSKSGRDCDKVSEAGLTPIELEEGVMTFSEARITVQGRKIFKTDMKECDFIDKSLLTSYGEGSGGFHTVYVIGIEKVFKAQ